MAYNLIYAMGLFFNDCKAWNHLCAKQKTMDNLKTTFQQAQRELCDRQRTAQQAGFQANGIWCLPTSKNGHPLHKTAEALANLATSTASDCQALQNLTNTVIELSNQIKAKDRQIKDIIKAMNNKKTMGNNNRSTRWEKKTVAVTATLMGTWLTPNTTPKLAANQAVTITGTQPVKTPWVATWKTNPTI